MTVRSLQYPLLATKGKEFLQLSWLGLLRGRMFDEAFQELPAVIQGCDGLQPSKSGGLLNLAQDLEGAGLSAPC